MTEWGAAPNRGERGRPAPDGLAGPPAGGYRIGCSVCARRVTPLGQCAPPGRHLSIPPEPRGAGSRAPLDGVPRSRGPARPPRRRCRHARCACRKWLSPPGADPERTELRRSHQAQRVVVVDLENHPSPRQPSRHRCEPRGGSHEAPRSDRAGLQLLELRRCQAAPEVVVATLGRWLLRGRGEVPPEPWRRHRAEPTQSALIVAVQALRRDGGRDDNRGLANLDPPRLRFAVAGSHRAAFSHDCRWRESRTELHILSRMKFANGAAYPLDDLMEVVCRRSKPGQSGALCPPYELLAHDSSQPR